MPPEDPLWVTQKVRFELQDHQWNTHSISLKSHLPSFYISFLPFLRWHCAVQFRRYCLYLRHSPTEWGRSCTIWFSSYSFDWREVEILGQAVTKPTLDQGSGTCNSANLAWPMLTMISEFSSQHPTHGPAWLTRSDAAILLSGLEETCLHRPVRTFRGSMDFSTLSVSERYRPAQSFPIVPTHTAAAQNLLPNPPKAASPAQNVCSEN